MTDELLLKKYIPIAFNPESIEMMIYHQGNNAVKRT